MATEPAGLQHRLPHERRLFGIALPLARPSPPASRPFAFRQSYRQSRLAAVIGGHGLKLKPTASPRASGLSRAWPHPACAYCTRVNPFTPVAIVCLPQQDCQATPDNVSVARIPPPSEIMSPGHPAPQRRRRGGAQQRTDCHTLTLPGTPRIPSGGPGERSAMRNLFPLSISSRRVCNRPLPSRPRPSASSSRPRVDFATVRKLSTYYLCRDRHRPDSGRAGGGGEALSGALRLPCRGTCERGVGRGGTVFPGA